MLFQAGNQRKLIPQWFWTLFVCLPLGVLAYWFLRWFFLPSYKRTSAVEIEAPRFAGVPLPVHKDDFTILKGVGPKTAAALYGAAIYTFEQLGLLDPARLEQILKDQGLASSSAAFWQEQAVLAAAEDWEGLKKLQK
ncbi:MAG TPA: hypothetical protein ENG59_03185 [Chloroflexi bacterium]|nr:MAG: hypothetical protein DRI46_07585 [Chloroflexota bacterium]HDD55229.1 hypothetical protein [Chloroflexota bacterium]